MLLPETYIQVKQQKSSEYPNRDSAIFFYYVTEFAVESSKDNLSTTASIKLPIKVLNNSKVLEFEGNIDKENSKFTTYKRTDSDALFKRGDYIEIYSRYVGNDNRLNTLSRARQPLLPKDKYGTGIVKGSLSEIDTSILSIDNLIFQGYITNVDYQTGIITCEDNMYILKNTLCPTVSFNTSKGNENYNKINEYSYEGTLEAMLQYIFDTSTVTYNNELKTLTELGFRVVTDTSTDVGIWNISNQSTVAEFLNELKSKLKFTIFLIGKNLLCGLINYWEAIRNETINIFDMQENVISSELDFRYKENQRIKLVAIGINSQEFEAEDSDGKKRLITKETKVKEVVGDIDGEVRTIHFLGNFTDAQFATIQDAINYDKGLPINEMRSETLRLKALQLLSNYKSTRVNGSIQTFIAPLVRFGDIVELRDNKYPENSGKYFVDSVTYTGGVNGYRQDISLDIRYDTLSKSEQDNYSKNMGIFDTKDLNIK